ncbi:hypothetical protein EUGRSUZ_H01507 [Eucalyptus grandis]|uniref:Uncharacterized protein n=2 Tax=Eucalyptus grandis TaxID=71139 RepID=A0A059AY36_EUCGR|nr:hypothetical protein EUGRSUZ_H01507 [Eucalyptus grandis]
MFHFCTLYMTPSLSKSLLCFKMYLLRMSSPNFSTNHKRCLPLYSGANSSFIKYSLLMLLLLLFFYC